MKGATVLLENLRLLAVRDEPGIIRGMTFANSPTNGPTSFADRRDGLVSVVIPTHNRAEKLVSCIESILVSSHKNIEVVVVDDASTDSTRMRLARFRGLKLIRHEVPLFVGHSINDGIKSAASEFVLVVDDDNILDSKTIEKLYLFMTSNPSVGVAGPIAYYKSLPEVIMYAGAFMSRYTRVATFVGRDERDTGQFRLPFKVDNVPNCFMLRKSAALRVGLIDADLFAWGGEDGTMQDKIARIGYDVFVVPSAKVWHDHGKGSDELLERLTAAKLYYLMRSKTAYIRKYQGGIIRIVMLLPLPVFFAYYFVLVLRFVSDSREKIAIWVSLVRGALDGWALKGGIPYA